MVLVLCGTVVALLSAAAMGIILVHAFRRSVGTGVMVLLIPAFILYYAFTQFEHRAKGVVVAVALGGLVLSGVLLAYGAAALFAPPPELSGLLHP